MASYSTYWEPCSTTLDVRSRVALLGIQLMKYGPTHHTIIWFSLKFIYNASVGVDGSRSDWSWGIWVTARDCEAIKSCEPDHEGSIPTPTQNKLIILVLPQQFYQQNTFIRMQNVCFCLKGECFSNLSAIFVVLITDQSASRKCSFGNTALQKHSFGTTSLPCRV